jgi:hypothetical protein
MSNEDSAEIKLVTRPPGFEESRTGLLDYVTRPLKVSELRDRFREFMSDLQSIVDVDDTTPGSFRLTEIQFSAEISANGEFKLVGTGVGLEASSAVTFVLQRKSSESG